MNLDVNAALDAQSIQPYTDQMLKDIRQRLIHVEAKLKTALELNPNTFYGHQDQALGPMTYSQHGEDLIFVQIFSRLGIARPSYLDIGAHHPIQISNTALLYSRGARGINIEANPNLIENFRNIRRDELHVNVGIGPKPGNMPFYCIDDLSGRNTFDKKTMDIFLEMHPQFKISKIIDVEVITINEALRRYCNNVWPDLLSIDIEGLDYPVIESANFSDNRPKVVCVEITSASGDFSGLAPMTELMRVKGFEPYALARGNAIYLSKEARIAMEFF